MNIMDMEEYGRTIREYRKKHGLSQQDLASALRLSRTTISLMETGAISDLGVRKLLRICDRLGLSLQIVPRQTPTLDMALKANAAQRATDLQTTSEILSGKPTAPRKKKRHA